MATKKVVKKAVKKSTAKPAVKSAAKAELKPETIVGKSSDLSFKKALKDALRKAGKLPADYSKFEIVKIEYEKGGVAKVENLLVTIKRIIQ